jgi:hypothetical protein
MTDEQIEGVVARILQRLRPPVLVMVTAADGYRAAIRQRLAGSGYPLRLALEEGLPTPPPGGVARDPSSTWQDACRQRHGGRYCCRFSTIRWRRIC